MANAFTIEAFTLLGVGLSFIILRQVTRIATVGFRRLAPDDYLMCLAGVVYALETATAYAVGAWWHGLANNGMTDEHRLALSPSDPEFAMRVGGSKTQLVGWSLYTLLLWLLKLCMCFFYIRLCNGLNYMKPRLYAAFAIVGVTYLATELSILFGCGLPFSNNWRIYPAPSNYCQPAISHIDLYCCLIFNIVSDAYLLTIPLPILWKAQLPLGKKLSLIGLFSGALLVMASGTLRAVLILKDPIGGAQAAGSWAVRETFVAVIVTNIPIVYQGFRKFVAKPIQDYTKGSRDRSGYMKSGDHELETVVVHPAYKTWLMHPPTPIPIPEEDSDKHPIVQQPAKFA